MCLIGERELRPAQTALNYARLGELKSRQIEVASDHERRPYRAALVSVVLDDPE